MSVKVCLYSGCLHYKCRLLTSEAFKYLLLVSRGAIGVQPTATARRRPVLGLEKEWPWDDQCGSGSPREMRKRRRGEHHTT